MAEVTLTEPLLVEDGGSTRPLTVDDLRDPVYAVQFDDVSTALAYSGEAETGSLTSEAVWRIKRIDFIGDDVVITWADGNGNFDNVWDDRLSLSYS